jgi:alpha-glucosidase
MLAHYRAVLAFRRAHPVLRDGAMQDITATGDVATFARISGRGGDEEIFCAFNLGDGTAEVALPEGKWTTIGKELGSQTAGDGRVTLGPWGVCLAKRD